MTLLLLLAQEPAGAVVFDPWFTPSSPARFLDLSGVTNAPVQQETPPPQPNSIAWFIPWGDPVRPTVVPIGRIDEVETAAYEVPLDRWLRSMEEPVRSRRYDTADQPAATLTEAAPFPETVSVERWLRPLENPIWVLQGTVPSLQLFAALVQAAPFHEITSADRWVGALELPIRFRAYLSALQATTANIAFNDRVALNRWLTSWVEPRNREALRFEPSSTFVLAVVAPVPALIDVGWVELYHPVLRSPSAELSLALAPPFVEVTTAGRWFMPLSLPVLPRAPFWDSPEGFVWPVPFVPPPPAVRLPTDFIANAGRLMNRGPRDN